MSPRTALSRILVVRRRSLVLVCYSFVWFYLLIKIFSINIICSKFGFTDRYTAFHAVYPVSYRVPVILTQNTGEKLGSNALSNPVLLLIYLIKINVYYHLDTCCFYSIFICVITQLRHFPLAVLVMSHESNNQLNYSNIRLSGFE